jgi:hypothetical protein
MGAIEAEKRLPHEERFSAYDGDAASALATGGAQLKEER